MKRFIAIAVLALSTQVFAADEAKVENKAPASSTETAPAPTSDAQAPKADAKTSKSHKKGSKAKKAEKAQ